MSQRQAAIEIIKRLRDKGYTALLAGGCVRDMLLGREAKDYDVATSAKPDEVMRIFGRTLEVGAKFGVVVVLSNKAQVEVATFRSESGYVDGRHPSHVEFADAREDASRRDFTINGMFYDPLEDKVIDYVEGRRDLELKIIRTIGDPLERFGEDYLRMLRAIRFSTQLGFDIEEKTFEAVRSKASQIVKISGERIAMELEGTLTSPGRKNGCMKLAQTGLLVAIFAQLKKEHAQQGANVLGKFRRNINFALALAGLWSDADTKTAMDQLELLKLSRDQYRHIEFLLQNRGRLLDENMPVSTLRRFAASPYFRDLFELRKAMLRVSGGPVSVLTKLKLRVRQMRGIELTPKPLLNGHEIIALGAKYGPQVGQLAEELYIQQLEGNLSNSEQARKWAQTWLDQRK